MLGGGDIGNDGVGLGHGDGLGVALGDELAVALGDELAVKDPVGVGAMDGVGCDAVKGVGRGEATTDDLGDVEGVKVPSAGRHPDGDGDGCGDGCADEATGPPDGRACKAIPPTAIAAAAPITPATASDERRRPQTAAPEAASHVRVTSVSWTVRN